jgi:hypothetical protein
VLAAQAGRGMNVVAVIHQPCLSIYTMFDTVALLEKGQVGGGVCLGGGGEPPVWRLHKGRVGGWVGWVGRGWGGRAWQ